MFRRKWVYYVGDFETTVFEGQTHTEVWASAVVEMYTEDVVILHSIDETFDYLTGLKKNICLYYHNLKFDGAFWIDYLLIKKKLKQAYYKTGEFENQVKWIDNEDMENDSFKYSISYLGQWYSITIKVNDYYIEIRDSLKLLPFSVRKIGKSFGTKHKKLDMEYKGYRYAGCLITDEEKAYIANDVLVVKEALEIMFEQGHKKLTIGSCCLAEFKKTHDKEDYKIWFPDLYEIQLNEDIYGAKTAGDYIRKSYKGGWCYLVKGKENIKKRNGTTADVNSLYPSMMSSESGNYYPIGRPHFWEGNYIPFEVLNRLEDNSCYYFVRIRTRFYIKENMLPCIQIKGNMRYKSTEWLETSDLYDKTQNAYCKYYKDLHGEIHPTLVTLTLTMTDFELIQEHYDLVDFEILDGCWFYAEIGLFDEYINKYKQIKMTSKGAIRELAKLFLNNLYGKMASNKDSSFKVAFIKDDNSVGFMDVKENEKQAGYIPIGSAITSYARNFTIRAAQKNYHGVNERGFIYADTDSIHCDLSPDEITGINVDDVNFCCWKLESQWDEGLFVRQKTYAEHIAIKDGEKIDKPYYDLKCAGLPEPCKQLFLKSVEGFTEEEYNEMNEEKQKFVSVKRTIDDFKVGLVIPAKLMPRRIQGGVLLVETTYEMR